MVLPRDWVTPPRPRTKGRANTDQEPEITRDNEKEKSVILQEKRTKTPEIPTFSLKRHVRDTAVRKAASCHTFLVTAAI